MIACRKHRECQDSFQHREVFSQADSSSNQKRKVAVGESDPPRGILQIAQEEMHADLARIPDADGGIDADGDPVMFCDFDSVK